MANLLTEQQFNMGGRGTYTIVSTTEREIDAYMIRVDSDAVFSRIEINNDTTTDVRTTYLDTAGGTIPAGTILIAGESNWFSAITLTSGVVTLFRVPSSYNV